MYRFLRASQLKMSPLENEISLVVSFHPNTVVLYYSTTASLWVTCPWMLFLPISTAHIKPVPWGYVPFENIIKNAIIFSSVYPSGMIRSGLQSAPNREKYVSSHLQLLLTEKTYLKLAVTRTVANFQTVYYMRFTEALHKPPGNLICKKETIHGKLIQPWN